VKLGCSTDERKIAISQLWLWGDGPLRERAITAAVIGKIASAAEANHQFCSILGEFESPVEADFCNLIAASMIFHLIVASKTIFHSAV